MILGFTRGGPIIIPFHLLMVMSFSLSKPHDTVPSDVPPFWPSSNSSSNLKLLGIALDKKKNTIDYLLITNIYIVFMIVYKYRNILLLTLRVRKLLKNKYSSSYSLAPPVFGPAIIIPWNFDGSSSLSRLQLNLDFFFSSI